MATEKSDDIVPEHIWRATQHYHDLLELKKYWEAAGAPTPEHFHEELVRVHKRLEEALAEENSQGGTYHSHRERKKRDETGPRKLHSSGPKAGARAEGHQSGSGGHDGSGDPLREAVPIRRKGL